MPNANDKLLRKESAKQSDQQLVRMLREAQGNGTPLGVLQQRTL